MDQPVVRPLLIDRSKSNLTFSSWRLSRGAVTGVSENELEASVATTDPTELDYVNTYFSALHNNLLSGGQFVFLRKDSELYLQRLSHSASPTLTTETVLPTPNQETSQPAGIEAMLPPSVAEVACADGQPTGLLLVSTGGGDLVAAREVPGGQVSLTAAVYPLRPAPPLQGCRPFFLEAAMQVPGTTWLRCVLWAVKGRAGSQPSRCEVFAATLGLAPADPAGGQGTTAVTAQEQLCVVDVQLLKRSPLTPHGVLLNPASGAVLLAAAPPSEGEPEGQASSGQGCATHGHAGVPNVSLSSNALVTLWPSPAHSAGVGRPPAAHTIERSPQQHQAPAACPHWKQPQREPEPVDDGEDPVSPRTLQAAVARLEQFTSQEQAGPQPPSHYADLYSESGPDGVGDLGQEPSCTLYTFDAQLRCREQVPCLPHKVLTCHRQAGHLLLGLTDDVDCAVIELAPAGSQASAAEQNQGDPDTRSTFEGGFTIRHVGSIPALAYVAAGKMQRKFLLLLPPASGSSLAAVLLESHVYAYLYRETTPGQEYGEQEMVELGFEQGRPGVVGAALVGGERGGGSRLFLLSDRTLRVYDLI